jgi:chemotaxis protein methyltransferase WspC
VLSGLLAPKGFLFVGPSETGLMLSHGFDSAKIPLAFAFRKPGAVPRERRTDGTMPLRLPKPGPPAVAAKRITTLPPPHPAMPAPAISVPTPAAATRPLDVIAQLADEGHLAEAARQCEEHLRTQQPTARAFYLLGLIRDAAGQHKDAAALYRKALYLEPNHPEALMHLAYLLEKGGDAAGAKVLSARARRASAKESSRQGHEP